eukprot:TRINITY_DN7151_c0_g1_i9.p1 TRINITY_DN7151_c0_g1~~TRINITY_DN7151_c0_g1_i9.p1  ORF type:complete len:157 (+),score=27.70 TRINITY_DN7151_c0_g1_i9:76-546(+)
MCIRDRSISLIKSDRGTDSATQVYFGAVRPDGPDCLSLVAVNKKRLARVPQEMKDSKQRLEESVRGIIIKGVQGKRFNEAENKIVAVNISKQVKSAVVAAKCKCNCTIGTVILESNVDYSDNIARTSGQDIEIVQVGYKNEEFNVSVFIAFVSLSC